MPDDRRWTPVSLPDTPPPVGAYSRAVRAGDLLFVSGQLPRDPATGELMGDDIRSQSRAALANLERVLKAAGAGLDDVVSVSAYLAGIQHWNTFNEVYGETFSPPYPTRTTVAAELHGALVEISAVAYLGG
ncbi:MAG: Rid family detoxifying hydrolase [Gemmatimonadota bacterium]|jgi:2-iminobutanoate/2-iminopropanoate deaminase